MNPPTLALVGCGAVAQMFHIPAIRKRPEIAQKLLIIDTDLERANQVRGEIGAAEAGTSLTDVLSRVDGVLISTPPSFHFDLTMECIDAGVHVLCETPLAERADEVDRLVEASGTKGVKVAVNHTRRFVASSQAIHDMIHCGELGEIRAIDYEVGEPFAWPVATNTYFGNYGGQRGVLIHEGAHILDLVAWWLGGSPEIIAYADDSYGGTEAVAQVHLRVGTATARVHLSRLTRLRNTYRVVGTRGAIEGGVFDWSSYTRRDARGRARLVMIDKSSRQLADFPDMLLENFVNVIAGRAEPHVPASAARASTALIEECYGRRKRFNASWHELHVGLGHV